MSSRSWRSASAPSRLLCGDSSSCLGYCEYSTTRQLQQYGNESIVSAVAAYSTQLGAEAWLPA
jgi:hypothetical protein